MVWLVVVPLVAVIYIFTATRETGAIFAAVTGTGTPGTFTATAKSCGRSCVWDGTYISDDGLQRRVNVRLAADTVRVKHVGDRVRVWDTGARRDVYADRYIGNAFLVVFFLALSVVALAAWSFGMAKRGRRLLRVRSSSSARRS
ncbi:hypothetical protein ACSNOI_40355 [Actinomadura kijaniata]|uniref:hypothetical protein n=1 Tax=Actinomadura kijaniata TaxID=46161 RepID=UPI003F19476D